VIYKHLPPLGAGESHLPRLRFVPTPAMSPRFGMPIRKVWLHRWAGGEYENIVRYFQNPHNEASAHFVFPGAQKPDEITQMVPRSRKSWTEAAFNRTGISIECADAIWLGHDPEGFAQLARVVAFELHHAGLPPVWSRGNRFDPRRGFCRHADGGTLAGGHTQCPTTDLELWAQFVFRVQAEHRRGGFRRTWGRDN
jgi:hypothetical protein